MKTDRVIFETVGGKPGLHVWPGAPAAMTSSHMHTDLEWNFITKGAFHYFFAGRLITLRENQLAIFWGGMPHRLLRVDPSTTCLFANVPIALFFQWELPGVFSRRLLAGEFFCALETSPDDDRKLLQRWIHDMKHGDPELRQIAIMEVEARLRRFAWTMTRRATQKKSAAAPGDNSSHIEQVTLFIARHYQEPISADDIAAAAGLHPKYLMQLFKRTCGMGLWEYVQHMRISHAQRLLLLTDMKLLDIAMDSGFGSASRFYATFQNICKMTPRAYRKASTGKNCRDIL